MPDEKSDLFNRLDTDPRILGGQVCIKGTRVPATLILDALASGDSIEELMRGYHTFSLDDVRAALA